MLRSTAPLVLVLLAVAGCKKGPAPGNGLADAIAKGDVQALARALDEQKGWSGTQETSFQIEQLRKERPLDEWVSILMKRNQLLGVRLLRQSSQMCPSDRDASVAASPSPDSPKDALVETLQVTREVWNQVGLHRVRGTTLHLAAFFCQPKMVELLVKKGAAVDAGDDLGMTPLHWASCEPATAALIAAKADVNAASKDGWTPLHLAVTAPIVRLLVAKGAKVDARDACGNQPLHTAAFLGMSQRHGARGSGRRAPIGTRDEPLWLRALGRAVDEMSEQVNALSELLDVRSALIEAGADSNALNASGSAPDSIVVASGGGFDD